ncbi:hypothetical protein [Dietzia sp. SYD-A1]|uniref:hypothetical protein n=1 Tax=Dietzia sp. SYD-A1 TaxID=2780141 RepID=UPI00189121BC|nr:hypothetical protein [Dietzia sp. SYD-A1]
MIKSKRVRGTNGTGQFRDGKDGKLVEASVGAIILWLIGLAFSHFVAYSVSEAAGVACLGVVGILHSAVQFWQQGVNRISAGAIFAFGTALFVFFPALYSYYEPFDVPSHYLLLACSAALLSQVVTFGILIPLTARPSFERSSFRTSDRLTVATWVLFLGNILFYGAVASGLTLPFGTRELAFTLLVLFAVCASRSTISALVSGLICLAFFLLYTEFMFTGLGRLVLGSLGIAVAASYAPRWPDRRVKLAIIVLSVPVLTYMIIWRAEYTADIRGVENAEGSGIASVIAPLIRFAQLIQWDQSGMIEYAGLGTLFASAVVWIPRALWPNKPVGFGAELAELFTPHLVQFGQSDAASVWGESYYSFGLAGLILSPFFIGAIIIGLDGLMKLSEAREVPVTVYAALLVLASGLVDLAWNGTFTYVSRAGLKLVILAALTLVTYRVILPAWEPSRPDPTRK